MPNIKQIYVKDHIAIPNEIWEDKRIGLDEYGVLFTLLAYPDDFNFCDRLIPDLFKRDGVEEVKKVLNNLIKAGYAKKEKLKEDDEEDEWIYTFSDSPIF